MVALAKHHPQQVCSEMLALDIPFDAVSSEFWRLAAEDSELSSSIFNNFLNTLTTSCLIEAQEKSSISVAALVPLKIFYVFSEMFTVLEVKDVSINQWLKCNLCIFFVEFYATGKTTNFNKN